MKTIRVAITDFPAGCVGRSYFLSLLQRSFEVVLDRRDPEYVVYSVFGSDHLRYPEAIRIFFTGENVHPDFNLCDYSFGFDRLALGDRHFRMPYFLAFPEFVELCGRRRSIDPEALPPTRQTRFCNFVYSNSFQQQRDRILDLLNEVERVDSAGRHRNNTAAELPPPYRTDSFAPKVEFQRNYRFSVAFENSSTPGYTTEKLVHALAADTIPIYWGDPDVELDFNGLRFVNCHQFSSFEDAVEEVRRLDASEEARARILREPFFPNDRVPLALTEGSVLQQIERVFGPDPESARRRNRESWGFLYLDRRRAEASVYRLSIRRLSRWCRWMLIRARLRLAETFSRAAKS